MEKLRVDIVALFTTLFALSSTEAGYYLEILRVIKNDSKSQNLQTNRDILFSQLFMNMNGHKLADTWTVSQIEIELTCLNKAYTIFKRMLTNLYQVTFNRHELGKGCVSKPEN